jgi:hypothetical protein
MTASDTKWTCDSFQSMSAFGGKADMANSGMSAFAVAIGGKADMGLVHCTCLLMTQSGHRDCAQSPYLALNRPRRFALTVVSQQN